MSGWHYIKSGMLEDKTIGPISDQDLLELAYDGKLKADVRVSHDKHTKGQWVALSKIPAAQQRIDQGIAAREQQKTDVKAMKHAEAERRKHAAIQQEAERRASSPVAQFLIDGQSESVVSAIYDRAQGIMTSSEEIQYIAVQAKPVKIAPDAVVCTNRRLIVFRQKILGQLDFGDYLWRDLHDARIKEGVMFAELLFQSAGGRVLKIDYMSKAQARKIYRIAQEREEEATEVRRQRAMEERRAGAQSIVVQGSDATPATAADSHDDPVAKLTKLKQMLDAGLIEQSEYDATKARILENM